MTPNPLSPNISSSYIPVSPQALTDSKHHIVPLRINRRKLPPLPTNLSTISSFFKSFLSCTLSHFRSTLRNYKFCKTYFSALQQDARIRQMNSSTTLKNGAYLFPKKLRTRFLPISSTLVLTYRTFW